MKRFYRRLTTRFGMFAELMQRVIGSPAHLFVSLIALMIWGVWSNTQHWNAFSALVGNDYASFAEYFFEILILAAALAASAKADVIIYAIRDLVQAILDKENAIDAELQADVAALHDKLDIILAILNQHPTTQE